MVAPADGWIQEIQGGTTGSLVAKDQILASFYSGDLAGGQQSLFYALNTLDQYKTGKASEAQTNSILQQLRTAETSLKAFGMSEAQIRDLKETRKPARGIEIRAPVAGIIISRNVYPNLRFERNAELYRIADLSRVWILVDTYGNEASYLKPGAPAQITIPGQKKVFSAKVSEAVPLIDPGTRTLKVRLEAENPGYPFKPDMLVDVEFAIRLPAAITAPVDAVLDSGLKKTIFVERGNGLFEPREVETGWRLGNRIEITRGLAPGERIVTSGTFLLDSESRMDLAASGIGGALDKDPVTGAAVSRRKAEKAGLKRSWQGRNYYFNSRENLERFMKTPGRYLEKTGEGAMPGAVSSTPRHH
jgi:RND family efflux transporter MFP subunit